MASCLGVGKDGAIANRRGRGVMGKEARLLWEVEGKGQDYGQVASACKKGTRNWSTDKTQIHIRRLQNHSHKYRWVLF